MAISELKKLALIALPVTMSSANEMKRFIFKALVDKKQVKWLDNAISTCGYPKDRRIFNSIILTKEV